jgi:hypothetical protein
MSAFSTISTETWRVQLPEDWVEKSKPDHAGAYFGSPDGTKGAYFTTWRISGEGRTIMEELESFRRIEVRSLDQMEGRIWKIVDEWKIEASPVSSWGVDCLDSQHHYRIVMRLLGALPWIARASFHDYDCEDYLKSSYFFHAIVDSFQMHTEDPD